MQFVKAERHKSKLRLALSGPSGSGKTYSALLLARGLGGKIAVVDTERGSASMYADLTPFDSLDMGPPYTPERFSEAISAAVEGGYNTVILDSISHEWSGSGGCLEIVDQVARAKYRSNSWSAWSDVTPRHRAFVDAMLHSPVHIIATLRSKTETAQVEDGGKKKVVKLGMKAEQRDGIEYEFTCVLDLAHDGHFATASKDRTGLFAGQDPHAITEDTGRMLLGWLAEGSDVEIPVPFVSGLGSAERAAGNGTDAFRAYWTTLTPAGRDALRPHVDRLRAIADDADASLNEQVLQAQAARAAEENT